MVYSCHPPRFTLRFLLRIEGTIWKAFETFSPKVLRKSNLLSIFEQDFRKSNTCSSRCFAAAIRQYTSARPFGNWTGTSFAPRTANIESPRSPRNFVSGIGDQSFNQYSLPLAIILSPSERLHERNFDRGQSLWNRAVSKFRAAVQCRRRTEWSV